MAKAFIRDNKTHLLFDDGSFGPYSGINYDLGNDLIDFIGLPTNEIEVGFNNYAFWFVDKRSDTSDYREFMQSCREYLYNYSPYFYFYVKTLDKLLIDIIISNKSKEDKKTSLMQFLNSLSEIKYALKMNQCTTVIQTSLQVLTSFCENISGHSSSYRDILIASVSLIVSDIVLKQLFLKDEVKFLYPLLNERTKTDPMHALFDLDAAREHPKYINQNFEIIITPYFDYVNKDSDRNIPINEKQIDAFTMIGMYTINTLDELMILEIYNMALKKIKINKCQYCGNYFVPLGRNDAIYCDRTSPTKETPCSKIAAKRIYDEKVKNDPNLLNYKKAYNRMQSRYRNKKITQTELFEWTEKAKEIRKQYMDGVIDKIDL